MKQLTWFWVVAVATAFVCLLLTEKARPDDFADHLRRLEAQNAAAKPAARKEAPKSEGCPCDLVGGCRCTPTNFCEGGVSCPVVAAKKKESPKDRGWQTGDRSFYRGRWWTLKADGWWYSDPAPAQYEPPPVYYPPQRAFRFFGGGNCGPSG